MFCVLWIWSYLYLVFSWFGSETAPLLFANNPPDQCHQHHTLYSTPQNWPWPPTTVWATMSMTYLTDRITYVKLPTICTSHCGRICTENLRKTRSMHLAEDNCFYDAPLSELKGNKISWKCFARFKWRTVSHLAPEENETELIRIYLFTYLFRTFKVNRLTILSYGS